MIKQLTTKKIDSTDIWDEMKMVDACEILTCGVASTPKYVDEEIGIPFLSAQNVRDGEVVLNKYKYISKEFHEKLTSKNKPTKGDLLYSRVGAKYGEAGVVEHNFEFSVYVSVTLIRAKKEILNNYFLKHYLNSPRIKELAKQSVTSSGVPNLNVKSVREFPVPLPPLLQQKQIVAILDKAFAEIDTAKANAKQNLQNAKELFKSYLQNIFENKGDDWEEAKWIEVLDIRSGRNQKEVLDPNGDFPILGSAGKIMGYANSYLCEENTTIIGRKGTINNPIFVTTKFWNVDTAFGLHAGEKLSSKFLYYFCKSFDFTGMDKGSGRPSLVKTDLLQINISFPSIPEQEKIINKIDAFYSETKKLETIYTQKIADLEEMKKSILKKAFAGQLSTLN